ncbi:MAG: hypothetical protein LBU65_08125 [Planctomycetaceae bacterium]|jgi:L-seryl-tRNA(Ser) seleniumtransferase|nr:hypothetical protein [Planctomycetaceae bacterium]
MKRSKTIFPTINEILSSPTIKPWADRLHPAAVVAIVHSVIQETYDEMKSAATEFRMPDFMELSNRIVARLTIHETRTPRPPINVTGILFHPQFGSPLLSPHIVEQMLTTASDIDTIHQLFYEMTGADDVLVLRNTASALLLLTALNPQHKSVVVANKEIYENEFGRRNTTLLDSPFHNTLQAVGTTNVTNAADYINGIESGNTAIVYFARTQYNNFRLALTPGSLGAVLQSARSKQIPSVLELEFALLSDIMPPIPTVGQGVTDQFDLVLFNAGKLIGSVDAGVLLGRKELLDTIRTSPLLPHFTPSSLQLSALRATLSLYIRKNEDFKQTIPVAELLATSDSNLENRANRLALQLTAKQSVAKATVETAPFRLTTDGISLLTAPAVRVELASGDVASLVKSLAANSPSVGVEQLETAIGQPQQIRIHLKTLPAKYDLPLIEAFE